MESCLCNDSLTVIMLIYFTLSCYKPLHCIIIILLLELSLVKQSHNNYFNDSDINYTYIDIASVYECSSHKGVCGF